MIVSAGGGRFIDSSLPKIFVIVGLSSVFSTLINREARVYRFANSYNRQISPSSSARSTQKSNKSVGDGVGVAPQFCLHRFRLLCLGVVFADSKPDNLCLTVKIVPWIFITKHLFIRIDRVSLFFE
jgi:hypothetical protein